MGLETGIDLSILYRGDLSGCNYDCGYCPFAKHIDDKTVLAKDAADLARFVDWIKARPNNQFRILFTPWGEALIRKAYQRALCTLSHLPQVKRVTIQTNLSCKLGWIDDLNPDTASLWCTYHPTETTVEKFTSKCAILDAAGIPYSVGTVGLTETFPAIKALRAALPKHIYLWVNAFKDKGDRYYTDTDIQTLTQIDKLFPVNLKDYESAGKPCRAGATSISVDGDGDVRRCHFISDKLGNLYDGSFETSQTPIPCTRKICDCHIGYVNMPELELDAEFDGWALGRMRNP